MSDRLPRVIGVKELLALDAPLRERPSPLVYFTDAEFKRAIKGAVELNRRPRTFLWPLSICGAEVATCRAAARARLDRSASDSGRQPVRDVPPGFTSAATASSLTGPA